MNPNTLTQWRRGCLWLDGAAILTKGFADGCGRTTVYFLKSAKGDLQNKKVSLDDVLAARAARTPIPDYPHSVHVEKALKDTGVTDTVLYEALKSANKEPQRKPGKRIRRLKSGRTLLLPCERSYVDESFVSAFNDSRVVATPAEKMTVKEAADYLGVKRGDINTLIKGGFLGAQYAKDGKLTRAMVVLKRKGYRDTTYAHRSKLLSRQQIDDLKAAMERLPEEIVNAKRPGRPAGRLRLAAEWIEANTPQAGVMESAENTTGRRGRDGKPKPTLNCPDQWMRKMLDIHEDVRGVREDVRGVQGAVQGMPHQTAELIHQRISDPAPPPDSPTDARGRWLYEQRTQNPPKPWKSIVKELAKIAEQNGWEPLADEPTASTVLRRWCEKNKKDYPST